MRSYGHVHKRAYGLVAALAAVTLLTGTGIAVAATRAAPTGLVYSVASNHSGVGQLSRASLSGTVYVFLSGVASSSTSTVSYHLDDPAGTKTPTATARVAPFDISPVGLNTAMLQPGRHTLLAILTVNGAPHDLFARFVVTKPIPPVTAPAVTTPSTAPPATVSPAPVETAAPTPTPTPQPAAPSADMPASTGPVVNVTNASELTSALAGAQPGSTIAMADGTYAGNFVTTVAGSASAPITLKGSAAAIIDGGDTNSGYALHLTGANYWNLVGFTVSHSNKGIVLDQTNHAVLSGLDVGSVGDELIHLRDFSSDNTIQNCHIHDSGLVNPGYGEGVYLGSAQSNWAKNSGGQPDASDRNQVLNNTFLNTAAESVDIKEATTGGVISGNTFDGGGITGANSADSVMDMKGKGYQVTGNTVQNASANMLDGFQTHVIVDGFGVDNTFANNTFTSSVQGYAIRIYQPDTYPNAVSCSNKSSGAALGLSNVTCAN